jgi:E3 ubiquitin-protein ligase HUWE1
VLPALAGLRERLAALGPAAASWEAVEELLLVPLAAPGAPVDPGSRRWVRQDFKARRRAFMEEAAKLASEGPIHKIEVRRSRCFKDSVTTFAGKGVNVWRQPLKVTFIGEAGMDSGGVTREWFSCICSALARGSLDLFWAGGPGSNQLYVNPLSASPSHLKRYSFVGSFMAKALLESSARAKELGPISLNLRFCEPFWKLLLGIPLSLMDLAALDPTEFRSLLQILELDVDGLIFETFTWAFTHTRRGGAGRDEPEVPALPSGASPFAGDAAARVDAAIPLKPGGGHVKVTNANKREYVLLKAQKMLMGAVEAQMSAIIDAFHSLVPRELVDKYGFSPLEMQLLVCGEQVRGGGGRAALGGGVRRAVFWGGGAACSGCLSAPESKASPSPYPSCSPEGALPHTTPSHPPPPPSPLKVIDIADLRAHTKYEDGYTGREDQIAWFWQAVESFDDVQRRQLLQFWSGSDGMPVEGFASLEPAFHVVSVDRMYDKADRTARLPAAHTCFRQLDLPRYATAVELREKVLTAITMGQGYLALS